MVYFPWRKSSPMPKIALLPKIGSKLAIKGWKQKNSIFDQFFDGFCKIFSFWGYHHPSFWICYVICNGFQQKSVKSIKNSCEDGQNGSSMKVVGTAPYAHIWYQSQYFSWLILKNILSEGFRMGSTISVAQNSEPWECRKVKSWLFLKSTFWAPLRQKISQKTWFFAKYDPPNCWMDLNTTHTIDIYQKNQKKLTQLEKL